MPPSESSEKKGSTQLRSEAVDSFRRYEEASPAERHRADICIVRRLGKERSEMWSRWITEIGGKFQGIGRVERPVTPSLQPPPEPPSALVEDIALLRNEFGRELLTAWVQLGRLALKEASGEN